MCFSGSFSDFSITSVVPGDYDGDSQMDVLLTGHLKDSPLTTVFIFWGHNQTLGKIRKEYIKKTMFCESAFTKHLFIIY